MNILKTNTFLSPAARTHLSTPTLPPYPIKIQVIFVSQKGMLEGHKPRQKVNILINKTCANRRVARVVCRLRRGGRTEFRTLGLILHMHFFSFPGFPSSSVRITIVFLVAELTQEIKCFVFL